jgi:pyrroloquinoline-quinone synthase
MDMTSFWTEAQERIKKYDLLTHPFYIAWSKGELAKDDLKMYAMQYYKHVEAFPEYLETLENRLPEGTLRCAIRENREDELGLKSSNKQSHSDMWLDFAEGSGADRAMTKNFDPIPEVKQLISQFRTVSEHGNTAEALATFYAYESQVPRIADEKGSWLKNLYGANAKTCRYFHVHAKADIEHAKVWTHLINEEVEGQEEKAQQALNSIEYTAQALWKVLDGIEEKMTGNKLAAHAC